MINLQLKDKEFLELYGELCRMRALALNISKRCFLRLTGGEIAMLILITLLKIWKLQLKLRAWIFRR